ncbi:hypothetical protein BLNAU_21819 [Blattamonas nauphoetae]|uniref:Uncharacterized protein n=1 Tax=Blattamonas nauphoetae TaxID=2049346 RepID=A0ABQ9WUR6_9EUKA|nr:hypothetical protein BLNAU_21819 [Blattamonas nauphoetae]
MEEQIQQEKGNECCLGDGSAHNPPTGDAKELVAMFCRVLILLGEQTDMAALGEDRVERESRSCGHSNQGW